MILAAPSTSWPRSPLHRALRHVPPHWNPHATAQPARRLFPTRRRPFGACRTRPPPLSVGCRHHRQRWRRPGGHREGGAGGLGFRFGAARTSYSGGSGACVIGEDEKRKKKKKGKKRKHGLGWAASYLGLTGRVCEPSYPPIFGTDMRVYEQLERIGII